MSAAPERDVTTGGGSMLFNLLALGAGRIGWRLFSAMTAILAARHLGVEDHGVFASALAACTVAAALTDPGAGVVVLRETARGAEGLGPVVGNAVFLTGVLAVIVYAGLLFGSWSLGHAPNLFWAIALLGAGMLFETVQTPFLRLFQGLERMHLTGAFQALFPGLQTLAAVLVVGFGGGLWAFSSTRLASLVALPLVLAFAVRTVRPVVLARQLPWMIRQGLPYAASPVLSLGMAHAPTLVLAGTVGTTVAGLYAAGQRPVGMFWVLPSLVSSVVVPRLFRSAKTDPEAHARTTERLVWILGSVGMFVAGVLVIVSDPLAVALYGEAYRSSGVVIRGLAPYFALQCVNFPLGDWLTTTDRQVDRLLSMGLGLLVTVVGSLLLGPPFGFVGLCAAAAVSEVVMLAVFVGHWRRRRRAWLEARALLPLLGVAFALAAVSVAFGRAWMLRWTELPAALALYCTLQAVVAYLTLRPDERAWLLRKRRAPRAEGD